eukprot:TRINITY_DN7801_c0_g7_i1.p1 TRINITY_DN7801_c0_g7~~TRINITY_DN7801_c0_g7_i1.p1  ORF type:complete len:571 (-),score=73.72 TRINITY_DN7801_c0_g7_i1:156-1868(-)
MAATCMLFEKASACLRLFCSCRKRRRSGSVSGKCSESSGHSCNAGQEAEFYDVQVESGLAGSLDRTGALSFQRDLPTVSCCLASDSVDVGTCFQFESARVDPTLQHFVDHNPSAHDVDLEFQGSPICRAPSSRDVNLDFLAPPLSQLAPVDHFSECLAENCALHVDDSHVLYEQFDAGHLHHMDGTEAAVIHMKHGSLVSSPTQTFIDEHTEFHVDFSTNATTCVDSVPFETSSIDPAEAAFAAHQLNEVSWLEGRDTFECGHADRDHRALDAPWEHAGQEPYAPDVPASFATCEDEIPRVQVLGYKCIGCGSLVPTFQDAISHCAAHGPPTAHRPEQFSADVAFDGATFSDVAYEPEEFQEASFVQFPREAANSTYREPQAPSITRVTDPESGAAYTVVKSCDGSECIFGEQTVESLLASTAEDSMRWVLGLAHEQLHGLVHEVGQRLLLISSSYTSHAAQRKQIVERADEEFFGLEKGFVQKDLDNAYRNLARRLHPDKNGGTEEAKEQFQELQERYERLKSSLKPEHPQAESEADGDAISYDPSDRNSLETTLWTMLERLRGLQSGM